MQHLGDITKISGYHAPVVDCIIGGSPCQELSVAGKRVGLAGERSGLFMEQIRIVKEMRQRERDIGRTGKSVRPRYMVWENVPGAFSSNQGKDFAAVLEETIRITEPEAPDIPVPEKGWPTSGCIMGEGWSVAWRVLDAQFWGVPQRRRRIALVADFGGQSAPEILFVRKGMSGDFEESGDKRQETAGDAGEGFAGSSFAIQGSMIGRADKNGPQGDGVNEDVSFTLNTIDRHAVCYKSDELVLFEPRSQDGVPRIHGDISPTLNTAQGGQRQPCVAGYIDTTHADDVVRMDDVTAPLQARDYKGEKLVLRHIVRRLTPLECERLQGFPDGWTDIGEWVDSKGKKHKEADSPRYKALGNSIALPPWKWVLKRICAQYERDATMASLFDGIGGFPLIWEQLNGKGSCLWASEIEEFPIAVTKLRFGGD